MPKKLKMTSLGVKLASRQLEAFKPRWVQGEDVEIPHKSGIRAWEAIDPYTAQEREEFRLAIKNPYVKRACRIQANFVAGQGYTTKVVNRDEEELPEEQQTKFEQTAINVPAFKQPMTPEEIKDKIDRMLKKMDLQSNIYNAYYTALQQGRCVIAFTPLQRNEDTGEFLLPSQFRFIRPEHTMRPVINQDTGELEGVRLIGIESDQRNNILDKERMCYIMHGFNNELFSDFYGDSKLADIADIASNLNVVLNQDYEQAALHSWYTPPIFSIPVPPQEYGNEVEVLEEFLQTASDSKGQIMGVTRSANKDDIGVELLNAGGGNQSGNITGLEVIRLGLVKAIIAHFGIPGFMLSEGDVGQLGGNTNISEMDNYLQTEVTPERNVLQNIIDSQIYDTILKLLWKTDNIEEIPIAIRHKYNKPKLVTIMPPELYAVLRQMREDGDITPEGMREIIGIEDLSADTKTQGADVSPGTNRGTKDWSDAQWKPKDKNKWIDGQWKQNDEWGDVWENSPVGNSWKPSNIWNDNNWQGVEMPVKRNTNQWLK